MSTPKIIHYCWFGGKPKPRLVYKCIKSWKKYCPGYEIREWNEENFDINCCEYVRQAYELKKWAFVSDYCRFQVLYQYGGIYLDVDVELLRSIDDLPDTFVGFELPTRVASGLIRGCKRGDECCRLMMESYRTSSFLLPDGTQDQTTVCIRETDLLVQHGLVCNGSMQEVWGTTVYPMEYFCPRQIKGFRWEITENTYSIHYYAGSWLSRWQQFKAVVRKLIGTEAYMKLYRWKHQEDSEKEEC